MEASKKFLIYGTTSLLLGAATKETNLSKGGGKPLLVWEFVSVNSLASSDDEHEIGNLGRASIVIQASKTKVKLENITLSMWLAANSRIMHELVTVGKLSRMSSIADYLIRNDQDDLTFRKFL